LRRSLLSTATTLFSSPALQRYINKELSNDNASRRASTQRWPTHERKSFDSPNRGNTWTRRTPEVEEEEEKHRGQAVHTNSRVLKSSEKVYPVGTKEITDFGQGQSCCSNHLTITREQMEALGFANSQLNFATFLRSKYFEIARAVVSLIY
jgi:hypothetical protein